MPDTLEEILAHFGVRGMRWGVRNSGRSGGSNKISKADKKWDRKATSWKIRKDVYNASAKRMNQVELPRLNNKPAYKNANFRKDSPLRRTYLNEAVKTFNRVLNQESNRILGPSPSGHYRLHFTQGARDRFPEAEVVQNVQHAAGDPLSIRLIWSEDGHLVGCEVRDNAMVQSETLDEILAHHGVKGMRWGVRRSAKQLEGASEDHRSAAAARTKAKKGGVKSLSNAELKTLIERMNLEKQYSSVVPPTGAKRVLQGGARFAGSVLSNVGKQLATKVASDQAAKVIGGVMKK